MHTTHAVPSCRRDGILTAEIFSGAVMADDADKAKASFDQRLTHLINRYSVIGGVVVAIIGAAWTLYTWDEVAVRESQKPFLEKQLQYYVEASKVAAKLTILPLQPAADAAPEETWDWAKQRFWELHWGELVVVEDKDVRVAMAHFGAQVTEVESCRARLERCSILSESCRARSEECLDAQARLKSLSLELSRTIRASIQRGWGYSLPSADPK